MRHVSVWRRRLSVFQEVIAMGKRELFRKALLILLAVAGFSSLVCAAPFEFKALTPQRADRLNREARQAYDLGLAALDKINYTSAVEHFTKAVQAESDNPWLRFCVVQVAVYLGDTGTQMTSLYSNLSKGAESIKYYDLAALNLKAIGESPKLNVREQQRAQQWYETITELRQSVLERDTKRMQYGREIAKQYAKEIYRAEQADKEKADKEARKKPQVKGQEGAGDITEGETHRIGTEPLTQTGPAENIKTQPINTK
jgi:hypothetical protein